MVRIASAFVCAVTLLWHSDASGGQPPSYAPADAPERLRAAITQADAVFGELQNALVSTLGDELKAGGPARAVTVCHAEAARIARRVSKERGILVGRTSHRLRNPENAPPTWARRFIIPKSKSANDRAAIVVDLGDRAGVLRPIYTAPLCTACHGPVRELAPELRELLQSLYPRDQAVDFVEGDLRGWIWAEVPLAAKRPAPTAR